MREVENNNLATTAVNVFEVLFGAEYSQNRQNTQKNIQCNTALYRRGITFRVVKSIFFNPQLSDHFRLIYLNV